MERSESYVATIYALQGFILAVKQKIPMNAGNVMSSIGRRMHYGNGKTKRDFCTPDLVIQITPSTGIIGEAKLLVSGTPEKHWDKYTDQLKRYDEELIGWWTTNEQIDQAYIVLITHIEYSSQIGDYIQTKLSYDDNKFNHPVSVIEFSRYQKSREYLFLRTRLGPMPSIFEKDFRDGVKISLETLIYENKEKKFYDAKPQDIEYIMEILWQNIFTKEAVNNPNGSIVYSEHDKVYRIPINAVVLTKEIQKTYGSVGGQDREVEYPHIDWVREALDKFVMIGLAEKSANDNDYIILFKKYSRPLEKFVQLIHKKKNKKDSDLKQLNLF